MYILYMLYEGEKRWQEGGGGGGGGGGRKGNNGGQRAKAFELLIYKHSLEASRACLAHTNFCRTGLYSIGLLLSSTHRGNIRPTSSACLALWLCDGTMHTLLEGMRVWH